MDGSSMEGLENHGTEGVIDQQVPELGASQDTAPEPTDLVEAFKAIRSQNAPVADTGVPSGEHVENTGIDAGEHSDGGEGSVGEPAGDAPGGAEPLGDNAGQGDVGGSSAPAPEVDYGAYQKNLVDELGKQAIANVRKNFEQQHIQKIAISQLYKKDERTGSVSFINPDDPNGRPFTSRAEAQAWCDAFNRDVDYEFKRAATAERNRLLEAYRPTQELLAFAPKFQKFDPVKQGIINDMIQPYEIKGENGKTIGYRCNLDSVAAQADKLIARFNANKPAQPAQPAAPQQQSPQGSGPAVDMKSSGSGSSGSKEPTDLAEALKMYNSQKRSK